MQSQWFAFARLLTSKQCLVNPEPRAPALENGKFLKDCVVLAKFGGETKEQEGNHQATIAKRSSSQLLRKLPPICLAGNKTVVCTN